MRRTRNQRLVLLLNATLISMALLLAGVLAYAGKQASSVNRVALDRSLSVVTPGEGGARVLNVLLVGSDSSANLDPDDPIQIGRQGERLGDVIILAHIDERSGELALLSFPRDLWLPIAGTGRSDRINRAFVVGGPATLIDTLEENFGLPIHHYVNVDFAGFQGLVEAVGSVDVFFETPARDWNVNATPEPKSQTGFIVETSGCHALGPEQALAYVRSRYYQTQDDEGRWVTDPSSDLGRIARQQDFLGRLLQRAIDLGARNPLVMSELVDTGIEHVAIDHELTPAMLLDIGSTYRSFEPGEMQTYTFPTDEATVGASKVLVPREADAGPLLELFAGSPFDSAGTVGVEVVYDTALAGRGSGSRLLPGRVREVTERLDLFDFAIDDITEGVADAPLTIRHGPDGRQAAQLVAAAFDDAQLEETAGLTGRDVVVAVGVDSVTERWDEVADGGPPTGTNEGAAPAETPPLGPSTGGSELGEQAGSSGTEPDACR